MDYYVFVGSEGRYELNSGPFSSFDEAQTQLESMGMPGIVLSEEEVMQYAQQAQQPTQRPSPRSRLYRPPVFRPKILRRRY